MTGHREQPERALRVVGKGMQDFIPLRDNEDFFYNEERGFEVGVAVPRHLATLSLRTSRLSQTDNDSAENIHRALGK